MEEMKMIAARGQRSAEILVDLCMTIFGLAKSKMFDWLSKFGLSFSIRLSTSEIEEIKN